MCPTPDGSAAGSDNGQYHADDERDDAQSPNDRDPSQETDDQQDDTEDNHEPLLPAAFESRRTLDRGGSWLLVADLPRIPRQRSDRIVRVMRATYPPGEVA